VRRVWPRMLVGLVRLLSGRPRDPSVGREVLIGAAVSQLVGVVVTLVLSTQLWSQGTARAFLIPSEGLQSMMSVGDYVATRAHLTAWVMMGTFLMAGYLVAIRLLVRHTAVAVMLGTIVIGAMNTSWMWGTNWVSTWQIVAVAVLVGSSAVLLFTRVGLVAAFVASLLGTLGQQGMVGLERDTWLAPYGMAGLVIVFVIAVYGFWVSLAGQPIFKDLLLEPQADG